MAITIRPAQRSQAKPLVGLYSESNGGKTLSALLLARGFAPAPAKVLMIETEAGRGEAYADDERVPGSYEVISLRDDFSPERYAEAIGEAEKAQATALIIDSASHEWESTGGVLDMAARNQASGKKGVLVWQQPKMMHTRHFMLRLLATPIPLVIVCMRAKYPMREVKKADGSKEWLRSERLEPKQSEDILFEMFVHAWLDRDHKLHVGKVTREELRSVFREGEMVTLETGAALARWAKGETPKPNGTDWIVWGGNAVTWVATKATKRQLDRFPTEKAKELNGYRAWNAEKWEQLMQLVAQRKTELTNQESP